MPDTSNAKSDVHGAKRFLSGVLWNWAGIGVQLFAGIVISPYVIRKLGTERYGIWALVFSLTSYYGFLDLGFRSAVVRFSAHFYTRGEDDKINELINTTFFYFSFASVALVGITLVLWRHAHDFFTVPVELRGEFSWLVLIVGFSIAAGLNMSVFSAVVEGFQRFDVYNRIRIVISGVRAAGWFTLLATGYGLVAMGSWTLAMNIVFFLLYLLYMRRIFAPLQFSPRWIKLSMFKQTVSYGIHTFIASLGTQSLEQTPSLLIGYFRNTTEVGFFNFPLRMIQYVANGITNVGMVVLPRSTELAARGELKRVAKLGIYANRYCLALFMPMAVFLMVYGHELLSVWVTPEFAPRVFPLILPFLVGFGLAQASQFCTGSILFGLGKQQGYARAVLAEAVLSIVLMVLLVPKHGILAAAVVSAVLMIVTRGVISPWLLCQQLTFPFAQYMRSILVSPVVSALPVSVVLVLLKQGGLAGKSWSELILVGAITCLVYGATAYYACVERDHRQVVLDWTAQRAGRLLRQEPRS
ncbi:MAG: oligosaccharide flippase family protein [Bryobacteraceae bacterium]